MLKILYGTDSQHNADCLLSQLCARAKAGVDGQVLIVPEQFSFDAERRLCERGGDSISLSAEVLSFTRLYDRLSSLYGGAARRMMDKSGRLIAMAGALEQVRSRLKIYGMHIAKPEFLEQLLALYEEFRSYGVSSDGLEEAGRALGGLLAEKLDELRLIFDSYDAVCQNAAHDPAERLTRLAELLREQDYAASRHFYLDGFTDFTAQELDVIAALLSGGGELTVCLCCDGLRRGQEVFSLTRETARTLRLTAARCGVETAEQRLPSGQTSPYVSHLQASLFGAGIPVFDAQAPLTLAAGKTPYDEALAAVAGMQALVQSGCRWREIAVACTDLAQYQPILERLFAQYQIPGYFAGTKEILQTPVVRMTLSALRAASSRMEAEDVLDYLKSGVAPIDRDVCDLLENYAYVWDLKGTAWERDFTKSPSGFEKPNDPDRDAEILLLLNEAREAALAPLCELRRALAAAENTGAQVRALYGFLERIGLAARLSEQTDALRAQGALQRAQLTGQLYDVLLSTMEQIHGVLGKTTRTPEEFYHFFRAALSRHSVGTIPATLDCVRVGSLRDLRNNRAPQLFVLGATDGLLPARAAQAGLLTQADRHSLTQAGLHIAPDALAQLSRELLCAYTVLTSASEGLFLSCRHAEPSYLYTRIAALFPARRELPKQPAPVSELQAAAQLAASQLPAGAYDPTLAAKADALRARADYTPGQLAPETVRALYGSTLYLSATRINTAASCKLAFFLRAGLKAALPRQARLDAPTFGTFLHFVLEQTAAQVMAEGGFHIVPLERVQALAEQAIHAYAESELQGLSDGSSRERYLFRRSWEEVLAVVRELYEELQQSQFEPAGFELPFRNETAVRIHGKLADATVNGFVDRVDRYTAKDGRTYVRVVDYKSGKKDFDYTDLLSGINLQMLIYLFALRRRGKTFFGTQVESAGVLYFPTAVSILSSDGTLSEEKLAEKRRKAFRRKGLLLNDEEILRAMEQNVDAPVYLPYTYKNGTREGDLASGEQLALLERFLDRTLCDLTDCIYRGTVAPDPYRRGESGPCSYCDYRQVCHVSEGGIPMRELADTKAERFWQELERRDEAHG